MKGRIKKDPVKMPHQYKLIIFDCDNTLTQGDFPEILVLEAIKGNREREEEYRNMVRKYYQNLKKGLSNDKESFLKCYLFLQGLDVRRAKTIAKEFPLTPGIEETISNLKGQGYKMAIFSDGFSILTDYLKDRLGFDYAFSNHLVIKDNKLTGQVIIPYPNPSPPTLPSPSRGRVRACPERSEGEGMRGCLGHLTCKRLLMQKLCKEMAIDRSQVIAIGDGLSDICLFKEAGLSIAFCPSAFQKVKDLYPIEKIAHEVIWEKDLRRVLEVINKSSQNPVSSSTLST